MLMRRSVLARCLVAGLVAAALTVPMSMGAPAGASAKSSAKSAGGGSDRKRQLEAQTSLTAEKSAQYAAHTERLEQRVRVLEQIATDRGVDTAAQIEALRAPRLTGQEPN